jgi:hypothetical protein
MLTCLNRPLELHSCFDGSQSGKSSRIWNTLYEPAYLPNVHTECLGTFCWLMRRAGTSYPYLRMLSILLVSYGSPSEWLSH